LFCFLFHSTLSDCENGAVYQQGEVEQRDWFVCCLYVMRTADANLIRQWLVLEKDRFAMLEVMALMLDSFKVGCREACDGLGWLLQMISFVAKLFL
jgi:hypothetical protein